MYEYKQSFPRKQHRDLSVKSLSWMLPLTGAGFLVVIVRIAVFIWHASQPAGSSPASASSSLPRRRIITTIFCRCSKMYFYLRSARQLADKPLYTSSVISSASVAASSPMTPGNELYTAFFPWKPCPSPSHRHHHRQNSEIWSDFSRQR